MPEHLPRLGSGPVVLRAFTFDDLALIQDASADALIPLITSVPVTSDVWAARAFVNRQHARVRDGQGYSFAIADAATDEALGQIGLWLSGIENGRVSIGYWVAARHRGRGIARHGLQAISQWGSLLPGVHRLELYVEPWNEASWRTAESVGYQREGLLRSWQAVGDQRRDMYMYALLPSGGQDVEALPRDPTAQRSAT
jgi:RimJ/RimL family protein N-acetyltransferase